MNPIGSSARSPAEGNLVAIMTRMALFNSGSTASLFHHPGKQCLLASSRTDAATEAATLSVIEAFRVLILTASCSRGGPVGFLDR